MPPRDLRTDEIDHAISSEETHLLRDGRCSNEPEEQRIGGGKERKLLLTTVSLGCVMLVQSYLLVSVFSYSGFLAMHLVPNLNEETAGSYAGLIASSFMIGRTFSSFQWGKLADKYGRIFVIKASLILCGVFSLLFGLAPTFFMALLFRFLLGLCNGLGGAVKTVISEIANGDDTKETRNMALVMGMWGYGFLLNPAIGGFLSDPVKQYPNAGIVETWEPLLTAFPFLLPNLVGFVFCLFSYAMVDNYVEETLPDRKRQEFRMQNIVIASFENISGILRSVSSWGLFKCLNYANVEMPSISMDACKDRSEVLPEWSRPSPSYTSTLMMHSSHSEKDRKSDKKEEKEETEDEDPTTIESLMKRDSTRQHLMLYWVFSFLQSSFDESFPLFCISIDSGLGIQEKLVGSIFTSMGFFYVLIQFFLLTKLVDQFGLYKALTVGCFFSIPLSALIPISLVSNRAAPEGHLTWATLGFLSITYAIIYAFSSVTFSTITMATNRTVPTHQRATMNGLSMLGGSVSKALGPIFAGNLFSASVRNITPPYGSVVVYSTIAAFGLCLFIQAHVLQQKENSKQKPIPSVEVLVCKEGIEEEEETRTS